MMRNFKLLVLYVFMPVMGMSVLTSCGKTDKGTFTIGKNFIKDVEILSSAEFEGRAPASPGGTKTINYIRSRFMEAGLKPGNGDSWFQAVPLLETEAMDISPLTFTGSNFSLPFHYADDMVIGSYRLEEEIVLDNSELVFAGYGIVAPEYNWNDYEGLDVKGKTVIILVNDPGFTGGDPSLFTGRAMTYYGRWTYKFEEAARQGAAAALIIHQSEPASYGWEVVRNSWSGPQYNVVVNGNSNRLLAEGWIQYPVAEKLFSEAGIDLEQAMARAARPGFTAIPLNAAASVRFKNRFSHKECYNVLGYIEGTRYPDETVIYMAHWDHLGMTEGKNGTEIYHGALDNATGVAALFAIAEAFRSEKKAPERSVLFIAVTAEESGLLGSKFYAEHPTFPVATTVGGINIDALNVYGPTRDVISIGHGFSELDDFLEKHAAAQGRVIKPDPYPERGYYYRSDHFNMARKGVPMIYAKGGNDYIGKDESFLKMVQEDNAGRYHTPNDVIHDLWNFEGIKQDLLLLYHTGREIANSLAFPNWVDGSEFRMVRDSTRHLRRQ